MFVEEVSWFIVAISKDACASELREPKFVPLLDIEKSAKNFM